MQRTALICLLLAGTFMAAHGATKATKATPVVCDEGQGSVLDQLMLFNTTYRPFSLAKYFLSAVGPTFNGTVFIPTDRSLNATLFELFLTPLNITGPLPPGLTPDQLLEPFLPDLVKYHIVPNSMVDPSAITTGFDPETGSVDLGPYKTMMSKTALTTVCTKDTIDPETYGQDLSVTVSNAGDPTAVFSAGSSAAVNATLTPCGGIINVLDVFALFPCYPDITTMPALAKTLNDTVYAANQTYLESLKKKKSAAGATGVTAFSVVASCVLVLLGTVSGL